MQRKNNFLTPLKSRGGFAMITAIIVVMIIGTLMAFSLALVSDTSKRTTDLYLYEQTVLYSKSAAELALLDIAQGGPCTTITPYTLGAIYDVNVTLNYIYYDDPSTAINESPCGTMVVHTPEQNGSVLMDITVTTNEGSEPIRYFRRVMQKL
jgi:hypothetical protein